MNGLTKRIISILLSAVSVGSVFVPAASAQENTQRLLGDVNLDNRISLKDASLVQRASVMLTALSDEQNMLADVDSTEGVTLKDAYIIQKYAISVIALYPKNSEGYSIGDTVMFEDNSDTDTENTDTVTDTSTEETDTTVTDTSTEETDTTATDTSTEETDTTVTDTSTEETDTTVTDTSTEETDTTATDTSTEETDTTATDTSTEETDTTVTDTSTEETDSEEPVVELPLEQINAELNGDFEKGDVIPDGWEKFWDWMSGGTAAGEGVNGSKAIKISHDSNRLSFVVHRVNGLKPGADYKFKVKVRGNAITRKTENGLGIDVGTCMNGMYQTAKAEDGSLERGKGYMMYTTENWLDGTFDWKELTCYFVADGRGRADIVFYLDAQGTAWYDDIVIETADLDSEVTEVRRFEGKHTGIIVFSEDIADLSEEDVQSWADDFDTAYEQMADLMGGYPFYGDKCYFASSKEPMVNQFEALGGINPIKWARPYMKRHCKDWCTSGIQTAVMYHEMGHNFDTLYPWSHSLENTADFKSAYVILQKTEGSVYPVSTAKAIPVTEYMEFLKSGGSTSYDATLAQRKNYDNVNYYDSVAYLLVRTCESVGWDTVKSVYRQFLKYYDTSYSKNHSKFMYWIMNLQNTYNSTHPDATGYEIYDSFPEGELDYYKQIIVNCSGTQGYDVNKDIHCVKFLDPDGNRLWFEFVPHGNAASPKAIPDHEKYGAFTGWDQDISSVTSDMTVTANYEKFKFSGTVTSSQDTIYEGEFVDFTVNPDGEHGYVYNIIAMRDGVKVYESGYTQNISAKIFMDKAGSYSVYAQLKDPDGNEYSTSKMYFTAGKAVTIYYSGFNNPNIHYKAENGAWTKVPGVKMNPNSDVSGYAYKYVIPINSEGGKAEICFNDGNNNWDNNGEKNYSVTEGAYGIKNGSVTQITG